MFHVLHSSAGAGKTHALVKHYLGHCLRGEDHAAYRHVLALTFTNKAAGEMKERVMGYLEQLAQQRLDSAAIRDVMNDLVQQSGADEGTIAQRAEACLGHMLHHWSDVAISTIDAFTRKVVRPFARDLQLDHDVQMTTEQDHYLDRAVEALITEAGVDEQITRLLSEACLQLLHEERPWDPERPLRELAGELVKESAIAPLQTLRTLTPEQVVDLAGRLRVEELAFRRRVNALGTEALRLLEQNGLTADDLAYGKGGIHGLFKRLKEFQDEWEAPGPNALKAVTTGKWHSGKATASAIAAIEALVPGLLRIFQEGEDLRENGLRSYLVRRAVLRELYPAFALHALDERLETIKRTDAVAFFSDLTRKVSTVVKEEPVPFIYERMGERYRHFLIDEFQDTSLLQWQALLPLIENALSTGGSALLVGDAKQAIYRWRNGEVRLFAELPRVFGNGASEAEVERERTLQRTYAPVERLAHNRRSGTAIVAFNNALFAPLTELLPPDLRKVYADHEQEPARGEEGMVRIHRLPKDVKGTDRERAFLDFALRCVEEALADGFVPGDIAILVRGRSLGRPVAAHLVANGHAVVSPDGLKLSGDPVIELLVDLLRFLHTGDVTAAARIVQYQAMLSATPGAATVDPFATGIGDPLAHVREWCRAHASPTLRTTLSALLAQLARANGIAPAEDAPVLALLDEAHAWTVRHGQDLGGFLEHWERSGGDRSVAPPLDGRAVQVLTVHRSKGLQFPVVIVPNADMTSRGNHGERFWIDPGAAVPELGVALVRESKALRNAGLEELTTEAGLRTLDVLNLLYVAFTRPEQRLYAMVPEAGADAVTKAVLTFMDENGSSGELHDGTPAPPWRSRGTVPEEALRDVLGIRDTRVLALRQDAPTEWEPADPDPFRSFGNAVHDVLGRLSNGISLDRAIADALRAGALDVDAAERLTGKLGALLASPDLGPWFHADLDVRTEASLITPDGHALRPDRVVFDGDRVRVLDIKTGGARPDHHEQVRAYMHHLKAIGHLHVEGALLYVRDGALEPVAP